MPTALEKAVWPDTAIEPEVKDLIDLFFRLVDLNDTDAGKQLAEHVFTTDGEMITVNGKFVGDAEISKCRSNAWTTVDSRHHEIVKVFAGGARGRDLLLIGKLTTRIKNESAPTVTEFAARALVVEGDGGRSTPLRFKSYQAWVGQTIKL